RRPRPGQRRRPVLPVAAVAARDRPSNGKGAAGERELGHPHLPLSPPSRTAARQPRRPPQQVTWTRPITAPVAWFQTGITSGVGSSSTRQRFRAKEAAAPC